MMFVRRRTVAAMGSAALAFAIAVSDPAHPAEPGSSAQLDLEGSPGSVSGTVADEPVTGILPGPIGPRQTIVNPLADNPEAALRGMRHFSSFNCVGCHAPNGAGGMGPSLSNNKFVYGGKDADIFLSIYQGRPKGMPAWGGSLPESVIWELVAYIQSISKEPEAPWGRTASAIEPKAPEIEQVPFEYLSTTEPWKYTQPFSAGQRPLTKKPK